MAVSQVRWSSSWPRAPASQLACEGQSLGTHASLLKQLLLQALSPVGARWPPESTCRGRLDPGSLWHMIQTQPRIQMLRNGACEVQLLENFSWSLHCWQEKCSNCTSKQNKTKQTPGSFGQWGPAIGSASWVPRGMRRTQAASHTERPSLGAENLAKDPRRRRTGRRELRLTVEATH